MTLDIADEAKRHPRARLELDAHDLGLEVKRLFTGQIEIEICSCTSLHLAR